MTEPRRPDPGAGPPDEEPPFPIEEPPPPPPLDEDEAGRVDEPPPPTEEVEEPPPVSEESAPPSGRARTTSLVSAIVLVVVLAISVFLVVDSRGDGATSGPPSEVAAGGGEATTGEVFLEPTNDLGPDPFTENVAGEVVVPSTTVPSPPLTAPESDQTAVLVASGTTPGLYGGTRDDARCDQEAMIAFLEANADKAQAWADVMGIPVEELRPFILSLTPVQLRTDTRVTNHGLSEGVATPRQSVLQTGSAVLVDETGVPRARCACGNPLLEPLPVSGPPSDAGGDEWPTFDPQQLVVVQPGPPVDELTLADLETDAPFVRPVGSDGSADTDAAPGTDLSDPLGAPPLEVTVPATEPPATTTEPATDSVVTAELRGTVAFVDVVATDLASLGVEYTQRESGIDLLVSADGAITGTFGALYDVIEGECHATSWISGELAGTAVGAAASGTWVGHVTDSPVEGSCPDELMMDEDVAGAWTATLEAGGTRLVGVIALEGRSLFDVEAEAGS